MSNGVELESQVAAAEEASRQRAGRRFWWIWLVVGSLLALFAVGGRWGLPLAAWMCPVLLLRFTRTSRHWWAATGAVCLAYAGAAAFWMCANDIPFIAELAPKLIFGGALLGGAPYIIDRLLGSGIPPLARLFLFPAMVVSIEFGLITFGPNGAYYGVLANTQIGNLALLQIIAVTGPYGLGFLIGIFATVANYVWERGARSLRVAGAFAAVLAVVVVGGSARMVFTPTSTTHTVRIAGVNPSKAAVHSFLLAAVGETQTKLSENAGMVPVVDPASAPAQAGALLDELFASTRRAAQAGAKIVVWSEEAARITSMDKPAFLDRAQQVAREAGIYLNVANSVYIPGSMSTRNESHFIGPDGTILWDYDKRHPVPGQEHFTPGRGPIPVVETPYGRIGNVICFDADFSATMHLDADIMLVPSAGWAHESINHTWMVGLRAIENGYSLVRQVFDGRSTAFDYHGNMLSTQDTTTGRKIWLVDVPTHGTVTVYRVVGDALAWLSVIITAAALTALCFYRNRTTSVSEECDRA
ncbi:carbon-nitrogen hydrolase family protein [Mycobacteroides abscessus subsp. abscessus]|uniref:carbon-nitrogen hydrolase family protein n=1 Tax=Mycobacteroides abscessus TaxID=36809 RepID=UPI0019D1A635|nr:carbon-nitrogen hydrolase family protein [Mycobacteroides abscessus]MBN7438720.1 carbon-nitrogen hydrolase family protein [Mycobacteroides abscessus subsp. abscessus]